MKYFLFTLVLFTLHMQRPRAQQFDGQEAGLIVSNVLFGGLTTGLGAVINKEAEQKNWPVFWKGFKYGCAGGVLLYAGKKCSYYMYENEDNLVYAAWGSRLIHNAGASVMENAALHRPVLSHYNLYVGFLRLEFDWQQRFSFRPRVMPVSLGCFVYSMVAYKGSFDVATSLKYGSPYIRSAILEERYGVLGSAMKGNVTVLHPSFPPLNYPYINAHENVHVLQAQEDLIFNTHMQPLYSKLKDRYGFIRKASEYIFWDAAPIDVLTPIRNWVAKSCFDCYVKNPYEFEAYRLSEGVPIDFDAYCR